MRQADSQTLCLPQTKSGKTAAPAVSQIVHTGLQRHGSFIKITTVICVKNDYPDCENILALLYRAYAETHESDPPEIQQGFMEMEEFLRTLPLDDNNAVFNLTCRLCTAYEQKAFLDGLQFGAELMLRLTEE